MIEGHLGGRHTIGVYPILPDGTCRFLAADFDRKTGRRHGPRHHLHRCPDGHTGTAAAAELGLWVVVFLPLVVSGLMAGFKVGELAAMLVSGSGSVGSGMMAFVVRGGGRAAASAARSPASGG